MSKTRYPGCATGRLLCRLPTCQANAQPLHYRAAEEQNDGIDALMHSWDIFNIKEPSINRLMVAPWGPSRSTHRHLRAHQNQHACYHKHRKGSGVWEVWVGNNRTVKKSHTTFLHCIFESLSEIAGWASIDARLRSLFTWIIWSQRLWNVLELYVHSCIYIYPLHDEVGILVSAIVMLVIGFAM